MRGSVFSKTLFTALLLVSFCLPLQKSTAAEPDGIDAFNAQLYQNALKALNKKDDAQAAGFLTKFLEAYPHHRDALFAYAMILIRQKSSIEADSVLSRLLRNNPDDPQALYEFACNKWRLRQGYQAQAVFSRLLSEGVLNTEQKAIAEEVLQQIYRNWDVFRVMKEHNDLAAQERFHTYQIAAKPEEASVSYALRGFIHQKNGASAKAEQDFTRALAIGGMSEGLESGVRRSLEGIARAKKAKEEAALWRSVTARIKILEEQNDTDALERYFTELIEQDKVKTFALFRRGYLRLKLKNIDGAEADFNASLETGPSEKDQAHIRKALERIALMREKNRNAISRAVPQQVKLPKFLGRFQKHLDIFVRKHPEIRRTLNKLAAALGQRLQADHEYARLLAASPNDPDLLYAAGMNKIHLYEEYEAQGMLYQALASGKLAEEKARSAREALGKIYNDWEVFAQMKEHEDYAAQERFHTYQIERAPDKAAVSYALRGFLRNRAKKPVEAKDDFEKALAIGGMSEALTSGVQKNLASVKKHLENKSADKEKRGKKKGGKKYIGIWDYFKRASKLMEQQDYEQAARVLQKAGTLCVKPEDRAVLHWHRGEVAWRSGDTALAESAFSRALPGLKNPFYRSGALVRLADYNALAGNTETAAAYAEEAALIYPEPWRLSQISGIYMKMKQPEKAVQCFRQALENEKDPLKQAGIYRSLAGTYNAMGDQDMYRASLREYLDISEAHADRLSNAEKGAVLSYRGDLLYAEGNKEEAMLKYEEATRFLEDTSRKGDAYYKMAEYLADSGKTAEAELHAEQYAALFPHDARRNRQVAQIFARTKNYTKAIFYSERAYDLTDPKTTDILRSQANIHRGFKDFEGFRRYNYQYMDALYKELEILGGAAPGELADKLWQARKAQTNAKRSERNWGFNSYNFGNMVDRDNRYFGFVQELYTNYTLPGINKNLKLYVQLNGTYDSHYSGEWRSEVSNLRGEWQSRTRLEDSLHAVGGVKISPFSFIPQLGIAAEQVIPISEKKDYEFRLRATYFRSWGDDPIPEPVDRWYSQIYGNLTYSTYDNDFDAMGTFRFGRSFCFDFEPDTQIIPNVTLAWTRSGRDVAPSKRWGLAIGPVLTIKKFLFADKYHAPDASLSFSIGYLYGLSHDKEDAWSFNLSYSF